MAKTIITTGSNGGSVIHDSDGKNAPQAPSVGKAIAVVTTASGKIMSVHGTISGTHGGSIVFDNPVI